MVKIMENPIKMDDLGGKPTILGNILFHASNLDRAGAEEMPTGTFKPMDRIMAVDGTLELWRWCVFFCLEKKGREVGSFWVV